MERIAKELVKVAKELTAGYDMANFEKELKVYQKQKSSGSWDRAIDQNETLTVYAKSLIRDFEKSGEKDKASLLRFFERKMEDEYVKLQTVSKGENALKEIKMDMNNFSDLINRLK